MSISDARTPFGTTEAERQALWAPYYEAVLDILGATGIIIPIGDTNHENSGRTTCTTVGGEQVVFTYSKDTRTWDTPPVTQGPARIPVYDFDGVDEEADSPDIAYFTRADAPFSIGAWVNLTDATSSEIISKFSATGDTREWRFGFDSSDHLIMLIYDEDDAENDNISVVADGTTAQGTWVFVVAAQAGVTHTDMNLYSNGATVAQTQADSGNFGISRDTASTVKLGFQDSTPASLFDGSMAGGPLGPFFVQADLSADAVLRLYQLGRAALNV